MPDIIAGYGRFSDFNAFVSELLNIVLYVTNVISSSNFYKLWVKVEVNFRLVFHEINLYFLCELEQPTIIL